MGLQLNLIYFVSTLSLTHDLFFNPSSIPTLQDSKRHQKAQTASVSLRYRSRIALVAVRCRNGCDTVSRSSDVQQKLLQPSNWRSLIFARDIARTWLGPILVKLGCRDLF